MHHIPKKLIVALIGLGLYAQVNNICLNNNTTMLIIVLALLLDPDNDTDDNNENTIIYPQNNQPGIQNQNNGSCCQNNGCYQTAVPFNTFHTYQPYYYQPYASPYYYQNGTCGSCGNYGYENYYYPGRSSRCGCNMSIY